MIIKRIFTNTGPKLLFNYKKFIKNKFLKEKNLNLFSFGKKNKNKIFYIIRRSARTDIFSNVSFVLNHLQICYQFNFIPIVDMKNFTTCYNEEKKILNNPNSWGYYFQKLNKYSLEEVYKSKSVILSPNIFNQNMILDMTNQKINKYFKKIKIKKYFINKSNSFYNKYVSYKDKILGVQLRGSTYKIASGHAFPATPKLMIENIDKLIKKFKYNKIFLVTEEQNYLKLFKEKYGDKCIFYNSYRMNDIDSFKIYPRKIHRFKLGEESLIEAIILSKCHGLTYIKSNLIYAAMLLSKIRQNYHEIFLGLNSRNKFAARWLWYLKVYAPLIFGKLNVLRKKS
jgi:hypothetical protein